jgi:hypothetical protein
MTRASAARERTSGRKALGRRISLATVIDDEGSAERCMRPSHHLRKTAHARRRRADVVLRGDHEEDRTGYRSPIASRPHPSARAPRHVCSQSRPHPLEARSAPPTADDRLRAATVERGAAGQTDATHGSAA